MLSRHFIRPSSGLAFPRGFLSRQQPYPARSAFSSATKPPDGKLKQFMKAYGYVGVGVYLGLSVVDLGLTMALIQIKGADKVEQLEHWIVTKVKSTLGMQVTPPTPTTATTRHQPSWTSLFVLAYGIHKTILLPVRLSLTAAVTPAVAKKLASLGWIRRQTLPKNAR